MDVLRVFLIATSRVLFTCPLRLVIFSSFTPGERCVTLETLNTIAHCELLVVLTLC